MAPAHLALLIAWLAVVHVLPVDTAQVAAHSLQRNPIAEGELEMFASCISPLDPLSMPPNSLIPKGGLFSLDDTTMLVLVFLFCFGLPLLYSDFRRLEASYGWEENPKQNVDDVSPKADDSASSSNKSWPMLPAALVIILLSVVAAASMPASDHALAPCTRAPLHAPTSQPTLPIFSPDAMNNLMQLPSMDNLLQLPDMEPIDTRGDALTVAFILTCVLIGMVVMHADVQEMAAEEEGKPSSTSHTPKDIAPSSSGLQNCKHSCWWSARTFAYIVTVVVMLHLAMTAQESSSISELPAVSVYDTEELKDLSIQGEWPGLPDGIVALITFITAAIGCKFCHYSDLLDAKAEEEERHQQSEENTKKPRAGKAVKGE